MAVTSRILRLDSEYGEDVEQNGEVEAVEDGNDGGEDEDEVELDVDGDVDADEGEDRVEQAAEGDAMEKSQFMLDHRNLEAKPGRTRCQRRR